MMKALFPSHVFHGIGTASLKVRRAYRRTIIKVPGLRPDSSLNIPERHAFVLVVLAFVMACTSVASPTPTPTASPVETMPTPTSTPRRIVADLNAVPMVDLRMHSVPLEDVVFDTFDGRFARLSEASEELVEDLRDVIKPIYNPEYGDAEGLPWLRASDMVIGYVSESGTYAYPVKVLNRRELVNDVIDDAPILVTYCPLCASSVVYSRQVKGETLLFGNTSALFEADLVMFDHQTGSYWFQVLGEAIVGEMTGKRLTPVPFYDHPLGRLEAPAPRHPFAGF